MESSQAQAETVLVTGGSGFLGSWCLVELLRRGYQVRTTVRDLARESDVREVVGSQVDADDRLSVFAADLNEDEGWEEAIRGCDYVLHVASPFPPKQPKDPDELIVPAREGALRVLRASSSAGVKRIVMTSSNVAVVNGEPADPFTEENWSDPKNPGLTPYGRSKTIAERAAWDFMNERGETNRLTVICPSAIIGPALSKDRSYSLQAIERLLSGMPGVPKLGFGFVDVRDVAEMHIIAMREPEAAGERFIATDRFLWMSDVGQILRDRLGPEASKVPTRTVPNFVVRTMARFDPELRSVVGDLGRRRNVSSEKARTKLGWQPRPIEDSIVDTARSLLQVGAVAVPA
jgi:dihydroflavonol-4-reductase